MSNVTQIDKDKDAVWVVNLSQYRFAHGTRDGVYFEPSQPTRVKMDEWIKGQAPILVEVEDPFAELPPSPVINENPLLDVNTAKPVTGVGTGPVGSGNGDDARAKPKDAPKK